MAVMTTDPAVIERPTLRMQRVFNAPRALLWSAWTKPEMIVRWLGPVTWPAISHTSDFRVGGRWSATLESTTGEGTYQQFGVYMEIVPEERLVFSFKWADGHEDGTPVDTLVTVVLSDDASGGTQLDFTHAELKSPLSAERHHYGWTSTFDRLDQWIALQRN
jgi:uncharacterized protein YndB with AHSA1/START domain